MILFIIHYTAQQSKKQELFGKISTINWQKYGIIKEMGLTDNGKNVITVTLTNVNKSTFVVENGSQGSQGLQGQKGDKGADGYTPVKGKDYFTLADVQNIVNQVITQMPIEQEVNDSTKPVSSKAVYDKFEDFSQEIDGNYASIEQLEVVDKYATEHINDLEERIGDIDTALDTIIEIQNSLIGGDA
jgi:hypothetical protein